MARSRIKYSQVKELEKALRDPNYYDDILSTIGDLASLTGWLQELAAGTISASAHGSFSC